jgi:hypothetical protein
MAKTHRVAGEIEIAEDDAFQQRAWRVQRIAWWIVAVIIVAALLGLTGNGPASRAPAATDAGELRYQRLMRRDAGTEWHFRGVPAQDGMLRIALSAALLRDLGIESIAPLPSRVDSRAERITYLIAARPGVPVDVVLHVKPFSAGALRGEIAVNDAAPARVSALVLP